MNICGLSVISPTTPLVKIANNVSPILPALPSFTKIFAWNCYPDTMQRGTASIYCAVRIVLGSSRPVRAYRKHHAFGVGIVARFSHARRPFSCSVRTSAPAAHVRPRRVRLFTVRAQTPRDHRFAVVLRVQVADGSHAFSRIIRRNSAVGGKAGRAFHPVPLHLLAIARVAPASGWRIAAGSICAC